MISHLAPVSGLSRTYASSCWQCRQRLQLASASLVSRQHRSLRTRQANRKGPIVPRGRKQRADKHDARKIINHEAPPIHAKPQNQAVEALSPVNVGKSPPRKLTASKPQLPVYETWDGLKRITTQDYDEQVARSYKGYNHMSGKEKEQSLERIVRKAVAELGLSRQKDHRSSLTPKKNSLPRPPVAGGDSSFKDRPVEDGTEATNAEIHIARQAHKPADGNLHSLGDEQSWKTIPLTDPALKFSIIKRVCQLYGTRIPDQAIASITNPISLIEAMKKRPKATKLRDEVHDTGLVKGVKNLEWLAGTTQEGRDREFGSHKVIEEELHKLRLMSPKQRAFVLGE